MSGLGAKISNVLGRHKDHDRPIDSNTTDTSASGTHGSMLGGQADPRLDSSGSQGLGAGTSTSQSGTAAIGHHHHHHEHGTSELERGLQASRLSDQPQGYDDPTYNPMTGIGMQKSTAGDRYNSSTSTGYGSSTAGPGSGYGSSTSGTAAGPHGSSLMNKLDPSVDSDGSSGPAGASSNPMSTHNQNANLTGSQRQAGYGSLAAGNSTGQGSVGGYGDGQTQTAGAGPHRSAMLNKLDPSVDSDGSRGYAGASSNPMSTANPNANLTSSQQGTTGIGGRQGASSATAGTANMTSASGMTGSGGTDGYSTGHHLGSSTGPDAAGLAGGTHGPHHSNIANLLDPNVDHQTGSVRNEAAVSPNTHSTIGSTSGSVHHPGRDAALGGMAVGSGYEANRAAYPGTHTTTGSTGMTSSTGTSNYGSSGYGTTGENTTLEKPLPPAPDSTTGMLHGRDGDNLGRAPLSGSSGEHHHRGAEAALAGAGVGVVGAHEHGRHHGRDTVGPHTSDMANRADPRVDSDNSRGYGGQEMLGTSGSSGQHHYGRDAGLAAGVGAVGYEAEKHHRHHQQGVTGSDATAREYTAPAGPHSSDAMNRMDPRVDSDRSQHHFGRDAGLAAGVGAAGYEADKHHRHHQHGMTGTESATSGEYGRGQTTAGPHSSDTMNRMDPRIDSDRSEHHRARDTAGVGTAAGVAHHEHSKHEKQEKEDKPGFMDKLLGRNKAHDQSGVQDPNSDIHYGRDAAGVGAVGAAGYEAEKHRHHSHQDPIANTSTTTSAGAHQSHTANRLDPRVDSHETGQQHHYGRDAAVAGGVGAAGYEAEKHHHSHHGSTQTSGATSSTGPHSSNMANVVDPRVDTGSARHHHGRDATAVGTAAGVAEHEHRKHEKDEGKPGLMDRLLHKNKDHDGHSKLYKDPSSKQAEMHGYEKRPDGSIVDPVTGLPMDVDRYGQPGQHGTDGLPSHSRPDEGVLHNRDATSGAYGSSTNTGPHVGERGASAGAGYGNTSTGAGPHHSSLENKLDPRVDSDSSRGYGTGAGAGAGAGSVSTGYGSTTDSNLNTVPHTGAPIGAGYGETGTGIQSTGGGGLSSAEVGRQEAFGNASGGGIEGTPAAGHAAGPRGGSLNPGY